MKQTVKAHKSFSASYKLLPEEHESEIMQQHSFVVVKKKRIEFVPIFQPSNGIISLATILRCHTNMLQAIVVGILVSYCSYYCFCRVK